MDGKQYKVSKRRGPADHAWIKAYQQRPDVKAYRRQISQQRWQRVKANPEYRHQQAARELVRQAVVAGQLVRQPCEVCGKSKVEAHHADYSKPLDVVWLCRVHHCEVHLQLDQSKAR